MSSTVLIAGGGTGGHLMPALAIAEALRRSRPDLEPVLVGGTRGVEGKILPTRPFRYSLLPVEPIYRRQWWKNLRWPFVGWKLLRQIGRLLDQESPALVIGTGGYASAPVVWLAARRGIPTAIQEQNAFPGLTTRRLARRVRHIYLGMPEAQERLKPGKKTWTFDTGNPILPPNPERRAEAYTRFGIAPGRPVLLITGGSQGSLAINRAVADWIQQGGGRELTILWAAGRTTYSEFAGLHQPPAVQVFEFIDPMADAMAVADLAVARAGAITLAELCAWGVPSILIPLPTAAADHQTFNARALDACGAAVHLPQAVLTPASLGRTIDDLLKDTTRLTRLAECARNRGRPDAAREIVEHAVSLLENKG
jgi:UDP-N-acetylglucosamine--N-acetylmuramyl-(pentapeptide) pyrophosphoryl-undecaprenol N-acetylglucosamine transferase